MSITNLKIADFRNLSQVELCFHPHLNLLYGPNGSGKTSILEALYYLSTGHSFRSRQNKYIIQYQQEAFTLFGTVTHLGVQSTIGIQRDRHGQSITRINETNITSSITLAQLTPTQLISPNGFDLLTGGPQARRRFLDWGVFHVEPRFPCLWQRSQRLLLQRNTALKRSSSKPDLSAWNQEFSEINYEIDSLRQSYLQEFTPIFQSLTQAFLPSLAEVLTLHYEQGWPKIYTSLIEALEHDYSRDVQLGFTQHGPHRATFQLYAHKHPAHYTLSNGQQKLLICGLKLSQAILLKKRTQKSCVFLLDDIPAELDKTNQQRFATQLLQLEAQVFATALNKVEFRPLFGDQPQQQFTMKEGQVISQQ